MTRHASLDLAFLSFTLLLFTRVPMNTCSSQVTRHASLDLAFLSFRLDFNSYYESLSLAEEARASATPSDESSAASTPRAPG